MSESNLDVRIRLKKEGKGVESLKDDLAVINEEIQKVSDTSGEMEEVSQGFQKIADAVKDLSGSDSFQAIIDNVTDMAKEAGVTADEFGGFVDDISKSLSDMASEAEKAGNTVQAGLFEGLSKGVKDFSGSEGFDEFKKKLLETGEGFDEAGKSKDKFRGNLGGLEKDLGEADKALADFNKAAFEIDFSQANRAIADFNRSFTQVTEKGGDKAADFNKAAFGSIDTAPLEKLSAELQNFLRTSDAVFNAQIKLAEGQKLLDAGLKEGFITQQQYNTELGKLEKGVTTAKKNVGGFSGFFSSLAGQVTVGALAFQGAMIALKALGDAIEAVQRGIHAAAETQQLDTALKAISKSAGVASEELNKTVESFEKAGFTGATARKAVIQMSQAELDLADSTKIAEAARIQSIVTGQRESEVLQTMISAISNVNARQLRSLKLTIDQEAAEIRYALAKQKSVDLLTKSEKREALQEELFRKTALAASVAEDGINDYNQRLLQLEKQSEESAEKLGKTFLPTATAMADLKLAALGLLGAITSTGSGEERWAISIFRRSVEGATSAVKNLSDEIKRLERVEKDVAAARANVFLAGGDAKAAAKAEEEVRKKNLARIIADQEARARASLKAFTGLGSQEKLDEAIMRSILLDPTKMEEIKRVYTQAGKTAGQAMQEGVAAGVKEKPLELKDVAKSVERLVGTELFTGVPQLSKEAEQAIVDVGNAWKDYNSEQQQVVKTSVLMSASIRGALSKVKSFSDWKAITDKIKEMTGGVHDFTASLQGVDREKAFQVQLQVLEQLNSRITAVTAATKEMANLQGFLNTMVQEGVDSQIAAAQAVATAKNDQRELLRLETVSAQSKLAAAQQSTANQLALARSEFAQKVALIDQESKNRTEADAKRKIATNALVSAEIEIYKKGFNELRALQKQQEAIIKETTDNIKKIEQEQVKNRESNAQAIRDIDRKIGGEEFARADTIRQIEEETSKLRDAVLRKDTERAKQLVANAKAQAAALGGMGGIENLTLQKRALEEIAPLEDMISDTEKSQQEQRRKAAEENKKQIDEQITRLQKMADFLSKEITAKLTVQVDDAALKAELEKIKNAFESLTITIKATVQPQGMSGNIPGQGASQVTNIGGSPTGPDPTANLQGFAKGGEVPGFSPTTMSDNILAWLTAGEFVQPVKAVRFYGEDFMESIRRMKFPRFAEGGPGGDPGPSGPMTPSEQIALDLSFDGKKAGRVTGQRAEVRNIVSMFKSVSVGT